MASLTGTDGGGSGITPPTTFGVWGDSQTGDGVIGTASIPTGGANSGVHGIYEQPSGIIPNIEPTAGCGVWGDSSDFPGVFGSSNGFYGVGGICTSGDGVYGETEAAASAGVRGVNNATSNPFSVAAGVVGVGDCGVQAFGQTLGIQSNAYGVGLSVNVNVSDEEGTVGAIVSAPGGLGAIIDAQDVALFASVPRPGLAAVFSGNVGVSGHLYKFGGGFQIDHPVSPDSKVFNHSFVESSERKNIYDGAVKLDAKGAATVKLPAWFEAVNGSFRYQLTSIGGPAPNLHVSKKISKGRFQIAGGKPRSEVSWQVTGVRTDPWAKANPLVVEEKKRSSERGYYLDPLLYKRPEEKRILWKRHPQAAKRRAEVLEKQGAQLREVLKASRQKPAAPPSSKLTSGRKTT